MATSNRHIKENTKSAVFINKSDSFLNGPIWHFDNMEAWIDIQRYRVFTELFNPENIHVFYNRKVNFDIPLDYIETIDKLYCDQIISDSSLRFIVQKLGEQIESYSENAKFIAHLDPDLIHYDVDRENLIHDIEVCRRILGYLDKN